MLDNIGILLKTSINSQFNIRNIKETISKNKATSIAFFVLFLYLGINILGQGILLIKLGLGSYIPPLSFTMVIFINFVSSLLKAGDQVYNFKNRDIFLTYPIKISDIVQSRILLMYIYNTVFSILICIPFALAYSIFIKISLYTIISWLILLVLTSIIPICISVLINSFFGKVAFKFKHNNYLNNILAMIIIIIVLIFSFYISYKVADIEIEISEVGYITKNLLDKTMAVILPIKWIYNIFENYNLFYLPILIFSTIMVYIITVKYVTNKFTSINLGSTSKKKHNKDLDQLYFNSEKSTLKSLYLKELKTYFTSRIYAMNTFIGSIMLIVMAVFISIFGIDNLYNMMDLGSNNFIRNIYPHIAGIMISMACTTHIAISYEGRKIWFIKSNPIKKKEFYNSKLLLYFTIVLPSILLFIISEIINNFTIVEILISLMLTISYMVFIGVLGLRINLRFLNYTWENETKLVKQSLNQFLIVMIAFIGLGIPITLIVLFPQISNIINGIIILLLLMFSYIIYNKSLKLNF